MRLWRTRWLRLARASALAAVAGLAACAHPQAPLPPARQPEVRVGLVVDAPRVVVGGSGRVSAFADGVAQFQLDNRQVTITADGRALSPEGSTARYERLILTSLDPGGFVSVNGHAYRGTVELFVQQGAVTAVNRVLMENYLAGVVSAEMGHRAPNEMAALAAQAIVSRTYALKNLGRYASDGFDLTAGVADQAYGGVDAETPEATAAVRETTGLVLTYGGQLILAFFHSTCGYATATPAEAFRGIANVPYLRSVSDRRPGGGYYCDISPRFRWRVAWDATTLRDILRRTLPNVLGIAAQSVDHIRDVRVAHTGPSGRATEIQIRVDGGVIPVFGPDIRAVFQTPEGRPLGSTAVQLHQESQADTLARLIAAGAGWGHGVGLCQWGAVGRARAGQSYEQILSAYFPGTKIQRWY